MSERHTAAHTVWSQLQGRLQLVCAAAFQAAGIQLHECNGHRTCDGGFKLPVLRSNCSEGMITFLGARAVIAATAAGKRLTWLRASQSL